MKIEFWHKRWTDNEIGFHLGEVNPKLVKYLPELRLEKSDRIFLPLCGKTLDIGWLLSKGYYVIGAELSELAIEQLFQELQLEPSIEKYDKLKLYKAENLDIYVGNIFDLNSKLLGQVNAIYDRAALVALPSEMRKNYTKHLVSLTDSVQQLLITFEYDQSLMPGPPFSVSNEEVQEHYKIDYDLSLLSTNKVPGGLKGKCEAEENVWLLR